MQPGIGQGRRRERLFSAITRRRGIGKPDVDEARVAEDLGEERDSLLLEAGCLSEPAQLTHTEGARAQHRRRRTPEYVE